MAKKTKKISSPKIKSKAKVKKTVKVSPKAIKEKAQTIVSKMPKREMEQYKKVLLIEKAKIFKEFMHLKNDALNLSQKDAAGDLSGYSYHLADMASGVYETDFLLRLAADERERLYAIDDALKRIEECTYGQCLACSKLITKKRLQVIPQTEFCLNCQTDNEKTNGRR